MRRESQPFLFKQVYKMASLVEDYLDVDEFLFELPWRSEDFLTGLAKFDRVSILHCFSSAVIGIHHSRHFRKEGDIYDSDPEFIDPYEELLAGYGMKFISLHKFKARKRDHRTPFEQWYEQHENLFDDVWDLITEEVVQVLFGNRALLLRLNEMVAEYRTSNQIGFPPGMVEPDGQICRVKTPVWVQRAVFFRDQGRCALCGADRTGLLFADEPEQYDHIVPLAAFGVNDVANIQLLCERCNRKKGDGRAVTGNHYPVFWDING